jgi:hypothetical protein
MRLTKASGESAEATRLPGLISHTRTASVSGMGSLEASVAKLWFDCGSNSRTPAATQRRGSSNPSPIWRLCGAAAKLARPSGAASLKCCSSSKTKQACLPNSGAPLQWPPPATPTGTPFNRGTTFCLANLPVRLTGREPIGVTAEDSRPRRLRYDDENADDGCE